MSHAAKLRLIVVALLGVAVAASCRDRRKQQTVPAGDTVAHLDTQTSNMVRPETLATGKPTRLAPLSPLADSIAERMVFPPSGQLWFTAAARGKRMLVDIGRVDIDVKTEPRASAYLEAVNRVSQFRRSNQVYLVSYENLSQEYQRIHKQGGQIVSVSAV